MAITVKITRVTTGASTLGVLWQFGNPDPFCSVCGSYDPPAQYWCHGCGGLCHNKCRRLINKEGQCGIFCVECQMTD